ncbi:uncharacterized protein EAF02_008716 [Botrytis sinoallii]|uniref:uncharacterized protein n=1 Tax=Botrytis sinoallii TaxID=1463999 RepID=UPI001901D757|nr:uncharacterized protein EAF02_008716 [Botrytis sinoallii]KAF7874739.1 hypothetical protein EAF02_008716 [Botrytis sinoallii]
MDVWQTLSTKETKTQNSISKMTPITSDENLSVGKLVALEGNINTITAQLRLLPHSHMILIVAPLDHYLSEDHKQEPFEARAFVRDVYIALAQRNEEARSFLQSSPQSKLAFLNGGSVSARAICVARISQRLTYGNFAEAETIFHDIVKDGVAGLFRNAKSSNPVPDPGTAKTAVRTRAKLPKMLDLRSTRSAATLRAKDLQGHENNIDGKGIHGANRLRSRDDSGLQVIHISGESRTITPEPSSWKFQNGDDIRTTILSIPPEPMLSQPTREGSRLSQYSGTFGPQPPTSSKPSFPVPRSRYSTQQNTDIDEDEDYFEYISQDEETSFSIPNVVYGEACVVDMQSALPTPSTPMGWTKLVGDLLVDDSSKDLRKFKRAASANDLRNTLNISRKSSIRDSTFEQLPKTAFVKASRTMIRSPSIASTPMSDNSMCSSSRSIPRITKGSDYEVKEDFSSNEPVFDIVEDVVIHFTDNSPREIMRSISEYRSGNFPIPPPNLPRPLPTPPSTANMADEALNSRQFANQERVKSHWDYQQHVEFDPFFLSESPVHEEMEQHRASENVNVVTNEPLPTPASATFPIHEDKVDKFYEFSGAYTNKSMDIQNEFRSFLNFHFPNEAAALSKHQNSLMSGLGPFLKDMFSNGNSTCYEGPAVDQILAVGCEKGISNVFCAQLLGQVEHIGVKKSGESRSGRIDLRFLIASAMQTFMSQPLPARKGLDPMNDPRLLADLIVPHLELYLATNSLVRFLVLSFPFDQIATVIALRSLLGSDLVRVAGVLDTLSSDPPSFAKPPLSQFHSSHRSYDFAISTAHRLPEISDRNVLKSSLGASEEADVEILNCPPSSYSLFFKADYHLPSTASSLEIENFLYLIRKNIVERLSWYSVEPDLLQLSPTPSSTILTQDASTCTNEELPRADSSTHMPTLIFPKDSYRTSSLYDSPSDSEIELPRPPTRLSPSSPCPNSNRSTARIPSLIAADSSSSGNSGSGSTIRHIPIAIERQSALFSHPHSPLPNLSPSNSELFPQPQSITLNQIQEPQQRHHQQQAGGEEEEEEFAYALPKTSPYTTASSPSSSPHLSLTDSQLDYTYEEDSDDDAYDRMVMGCYSPVSARRRSMFSNNHNNTNVNAPFEGRNARERDELEMRGLVHKGNSRKALKWLGLA